MLLCGLLQLRYPHPYNRERYVEQAIASFVAQSYRDTELLIWDDGGVWQRFANSIPSLPYPRVGR